MKNVAFIVAVAALSGCATSENFEASLETWKGKNTNELILSWGEPDSTSAASNGNVIFVYSESQSTYVPKTTYVSSGGGFDGGNAISSISINSFGGYTLEENCSIFFEIDADKTIVDLELQGNACGSK